ncbi:MAG: phosphocholine cytidylyltransferase family protein [Agathobacter sp.]|nr:phosphocholine cytidylyltransferase family protein [Agathobacter sp.]
MEKQYVGVTIIENPYYDTCNNISSLFVAREHLGDVIILDGDQIIFNEKVLSPEFERSGYNCVWTDGETKEWLLSVKDDIVQSCSRTGGCTGWQLYSVSRWSSEDGKRLKKHLELEFEEKENRQIYWDDVAMFCHFDEYQLGIREMKAEDVLEIDDIDELIKIDESYKNWKGVENYE